MFLYSLLFSLKYCHDYYYDYYYLETWLTLSYLTSHLQLYFFFIHVVVCIVSVHTFRKIVRQESYRPLKLSLFIVSAVLVVTAEKVKTLSSERA